MKIKFLQIAIAQWEHNNKLKGHFHCTIGVNLDTNEGDAGEGFLENLEITGTSTDFIKFAGTITGYGAIVDSNVVYYVWAQDDGVYVDDCGNEYVFVLLRKLLILKIPCMPRSAIFKGGQSRSYRVFWTTLAKSISLTF